jgi:hypothetical protein
MKQLIISIILLLIFTTAVVVAQDTVTCSTIVQEAVAVVGELCAETGRNQACYGNLTLSAEPQSGVTDLVFGSPGDIDDVAKIHSLTLNGMDESVPEWGVSLMRLQANLPYTMPGQNVTMLLFGDVTIENAVVADPAVFLDVTVSGSMNVRSGPSTGYAVAVALGAGDTTVADGRNEAGDWLRIQLVDDQIGWVYAPLLTIDGDSALLPVIAADDTEPVTGYTTMQAFYFRSGIGDTACVEAPDGILIQTPAGVGEVNFRVNGVDIALASTAFLRAQPAGDMIISMVEGRAQVTAFDETHTVLAGTRVRVPLDENLEASGPPESLEAYEEESLDTLPVDTLEREIEIAPPGLIGDVPLSGQWRIIESIFNGERVEDDIGVIINYTVENDGESFVGNEGTIRFVRVEPGVYVFDLGNGGFTAQIISPIYMVKTGFGDLSGAWYYWEWIGE